MVNKHMKRCSTSFAIRERQIKTTLRYHHTPISMANIQNTDNIECCQRCGTTEILIHCWWKRKLVQSLRKTVWQFLRKLNILLPYNAAITYLGVYPKELKTHIHTKPCTWMVIAVLFIIAKTCKQ